MRQLVVHGLSQGNHFLVHPRNFYTVTIKGYNSISNSAQSSSLFIFDKNPPVSLTTGPAAGFTTQMAKIAGTVADQVNMSLPKRVDITVQRTQQPGSPDPASADSFYWNGTTWAAA